MQLNMYVEYLDCTSLVTIKLSKISFGIQIKSVMPQRKATLILRRDSRGEVLTADWLCTKKCSY